MSVYMVVAGTALLTKLWILYFRSGEYGAGARWLAFVAMLALLNLSELLMYVSLYNGFDMDDILRWYYVFCILCPCLGYAFVMDSAQSSVQKWTCCTFFVVGSCLSIVMVGSDYLISGYQLESYPVTAVKSEYFDWLLLYFVLTTFFGVYTAISNYRKANTPSDQAAYFCSVVGLSFLGLTALSIPLLMVLGFAVNGNMILPVATTIFALITSYGRNSSLIERDPRRLSPWSLESNVTKEIEKIQADITLRGLGLQEVMPKIELIMINYAIKKAGGNKSEAARVLNISRSSLHKKIK